MHNRKMAEVRAFSPSVILDATEDITTAAETATSTMTTNTIAADTAASTAETTTAMPESNISPQTLEKLKRQAAELAEANPNAVGWLYVPDTPLDYPVMQADNNDFYLDHAADNSYLKSGSIFLDCRYEPHFLNPTNIVYGHNMANGTMFGDIRNFRAWSYYDSHPYGWLVNSTEVYRIDFFSLAVVDAYDALYDGAMALCDWTAHLYDVSMFYDDIDIREDDRMISLSTCASDYPDARAVLTGKLIPQGGGFDA